MKQSLIVRRMRVTLALLGALLGAACGFEPLMGQRNNLQVSEEFSQIRVEMIADRSGQILRNYLLDDLTPRGAQGRERYSLRVILSEPRREVAIARDNTASVAAYTASAGFSLIDKSSVSDPSQPSSFSGSASSQSTYVITNSEFATLSSFNSARDRVLQDVSADIRQQIAAFFVQRAALAR
jgi:LPS-assembly lipoprotein